MKIRLTDVFEEKLDNLPTRQKFSDHISNGKVVRRKNYNWYGYRYTAKVKAEDARLRGSTGRPIDQVLNIVRYNLRKLPDCLAEWIDCRISYPNYYKNGKPYKYDAHYRAGEIFQLYVDTDGLLQYNHYQRHFQVKDYRHWRDHYKKVTARKASNKKCRLERRAEGLCLLKMINRPDLFEFYKELKKIEKDNKSILFSVKYEKHTGKFADWSRRWSLYKASEAKKKLDKVMPQIEALERGEYNIFFESNAYLYNQQKECHHYDTP